MTLALVILIKRKSMNKYYIYILSNASNMLYVGLTTDIEMMLTKHRERKLSSFKGNFSFEKLIYVEETSDIHRAIEREVELKKIPHHNKLDLLRLTNPKWECIGNYWMKESA